VHVVIKYNSKKIKSGFIQLFVDFVLVRDYRKVKLFFLQIQVLDVIQLRSLQKTRNKQHFYFFPAQSLIW
jgi:hypothetical protein